MTWWNRLRHRNTMEEQLARELRFHLDQHIADLVARGHDPADARRQARLALGGEEQVKEQCRDARGRHTVRRYDWFAGGCRAGRRLCASAPRQPPGAVERSSPGVMLPER